MDSKNLLVLPSACPQHDHREKYCTGSLHAQISWVGDSSWKIMRKINWGNYAYHEQNRTMLDLSKAIQLARQGGLLTGLPSIKELKSKALSLTQSEPSESFHCYCNCHLNRVKWQLATFDSPCELLSLISRSSGEKLALRGFLLHEVDKHWYIKNSHFLPCALKTCSLPPWPPRSGKPPSNQSFRTVIHSSKAGLGCNKLESPHDSEQCAAEYGARMHNLYTPVFPWHVTVISISCVEDCAHTHMHTHFSHFLSTHLPLQIVCCTLMNKSIYDRVFIGSFVAMKSAIKAQALSKKHHRNLWLVC